MSGNQPVKCALIVKLCLLLPHRWSPDWFQETDHLSERPGVDWKLSSSSSALWIKCKFALFAALTSVMLLFVSALWCFYMFTSYFSTNFGWLLFKHGSIWLLGYWLTAISQYLYEIIDCLSQFDELLMFLCLFSIQTAWCLFDFGFVGESLQLHDSICWTDSRSAAADLFQEDLSGSMMFVSCAGEGRKCVWAAVCY